MKSFRVCALILHVDGSNDDEIHCFKANQPCHEGREMLSEQMNIFNDGDDENPFEQRQEEADVPERFLVDEDMEEDDEIDIMN